MEDIPGVGKTSLAVALAKAMSMDYKRVQFTPDVLPSDILGFSMYQAQKKEFVFHPGPVFSNLLLADEINRTSPKTQSALLEVMEEGRATVDGVTRPLPDPFVVIATQNPYGSSGTQMLPESQLDRFMIRVTMGYPGHEDAIRILKNEYRNPREQVQPVMDLAELMDLRRQANELYVKDEIYDYIATITERTREHPLFSSGASPRGAIALLKMARAMAVIDGRDYVTAKDVQRGVLDVLGHRTTLSAKARGAGMEPGDALSELLKEVRQPRS